MKKFRMKINRRNQIFAGLVLVMILVLTAFIAPVVLGGIALATLPLWGSVEDGTFKELTEDEMKDMEPEGLAKYFNELNKNRKKELDEKLEKMKTDASDELKTEIKTLKDELIAGTVVQIKAMTDAQDAQGMALRKLMDDGSPAKKDTLNEKIAKEFENIVKNVSKGGGSYKFTVDKTTIGLTSITDDAVGMMLPGWAEVQSQNNRIAPSLSPFTLTADDHGVIYWTDQTTRTNNAAARSDGDAAAEQVYAWTGYSETVDNISAMVPVHKEALKHISILQNEVQRLLNDDIQVALDGYCYTGTGTAPQIGGLYIRATAFDAAAYIAAGGFAPRTANMYDLIVSMAAQIMKTTKYNVDRAWVNPYDALKMKLNKDENGVYTMPPFVVPSANGPITVSGMQIIEANSVTAGTLVVGDGSKARLYSTGAAEIEVGYNLTGDFSKRILTILANLECSLLIRNAEVDAFLKSTNIDDDVDSITKVVA